MTAKEAAALVREDPGQYLRFVQVAGEYRFGVVTSFTSHLDLVDEGEQVLSAGFVKVGCTVVVEGHSQKLGIGWATEDPENIAKIFGLPVGDRY